MTVTVDLMVNGINCGGCKKALTAALMEVPGVTEVAADTKADTGVHPNKVVVTAEDGPDLASEVKAAIGKLDAGRNKFTIEEPAPEPEHHGHGHAEPAEHDHVHGEGCGHEHEKEAAHEHGHGPSQEQEHSKAMWQWASKQGGDATPDPNETVPVCTVPNCMLQ